MKRMLIVSMCLIFSFVVLFSTNGGAVYAQSNSLTEDQEIELIAKYIKDNGEMLIFDEAQAKADNVPSYLIEKAKIAIANINNNMSKITVSTSKSLTNEQTITTKGWKEKLAAQIIRHGGPWLTKLAKKISPKAAKVVESNLNKIANWIEKVGDVQEIALTSFLVSLGVPPADAAIASHYIVLVFGL
ncbi:hypothetical protein [Laceyella putida]|uniref:Secreted protein n=1 Tax=Laceyella putida TaxID=110101 RepID=A0ABW2RQB2_9BACL